MSILVFIKDLVVATFSQMFSVFGGVVLFGLLIHFVSQFTFKSLERAFGRSGVYFVAWLGTPVHELGHAIFCVIFFHRIVGIKFFEPDPVTGTLGYVSHKWSHSNPWQVLGNFFIGIGPVILGCLVLLAIFYLLIPDGSRVWDSILLGVRKINQDYSVGSYFAILQGSALVMARSVFTVANLTTWRFWVFLYLSICIASNIRLSPADIKGSLSGLGCIVLPFLLINFLGLITGFGGEKFLPLSAASLGVIYSLLILALIMALLGFVLTYLLSAFYFRLKRHRLLNPF